MVACRLFRRVTMPQRGLYGSYSFSLGPDNEVIEGACDLFQTAREAIASAEASVEQNGGGAFAFSQKEKGPFILLRKFGQLWPECENYNPGDIIGPGTLRYDGEIYRFIPFDLPTRRERRRMNKSAA